MAARAQAELVHMLNKTIAKLKAKHNSEQLDALIADADVLLENLRPLSLPRTEPKRSVTNQTTKPAGVSHPSTTPARGGLTTSLRLRLRSLLRLRLRWRSPLRLRLRAEVLNFTFLSPLAECTMWSILFKDLL